MFELERENESLQKQLLEEKFLREDRERELERFHKTSTDREMVIRRHTINHRNSTESHFESKDNDTWVNVGLSFNDLFLDL